jgi:hypothetical protein
MNSFDRTLVSSKAFLPFTRRNDDDLKPSTEKTGKTGIRAVNVTTNDIQLAALVEMASW